MNLQNLEARRKSRQELVGPDFLKIGPNPKILNFYFLRLNQIGTFEKMDPLI